MRKMKLWLKILIALIILFAVFSIWEVFYLQKAHSTFENYYKFRGCKELIEKNDTFGLCRLSDGSEIKIVLYNGKWFLDGDLPNGFLSL